MSYPFTSINHSSTLVAYTCIKSLMLEGNLSRNMIVVCPHCCLVRGRQKKSCHCGFQLSTNAVVILPAPQTATKYSNQSEGSIGALNQLRFKLVKGRDKATVNVMSDYVSACPTSMALGGWFRLVCVLVLDKDSTGTLWTSVTPDCCRTSSYPPL